MTVYYTTVIDVREHSQLGFDDLGFQNEDDLDEFTEDLIEAAQRIVDDYCGVPSTFFQAGGVTVTDEYYDGDGGEELWLKYRPVVSVTALYRNKASLNAAADWEQLLEGPGAGKHFILYGQKGLVYMFDRIPGADYKNIKVTYKAGYSAVPESVAHVCKELAANVLRGLLKRKLAPQQITEIALMGGDLRALFAEDAKLTAGMKELLAIYRLSRVAVG